MEINPDILVIDPLSFPQNYTGTRCGTPLGDPQSIFLAISNN